MLDGMNRSVTNPVKIGELDKREILCAEAKSSHRNTVDSSALRITPEIPVSDVSQSRNHEISTGQFN